MPLNGEIVVILHTKRDESALDVKLNNLKNNKYDRSRIETCE